MLPAAITEGRAGLVIGPDHQGGGVGFHNPITGNHLEEEGFEVNIPSELTEDKRIHLFRGTHSQIINQILQIGGHSLADQVTKVNPGDIIMCVRSVWDKGIRTYVGTVEKILDEINTSNGCNSIRRHVAVAANGGKAAPKGIKQRILDWQSMDPNSPRWKKKKIKMNELSNNVHKFRSSVSRDINSDDERTALTALILAVMDRTAERVGNDDSADNGHFGVTGFRKRHINVKGDTVSLHYIGKSGTEHHKTFTDERIAAALKKAIKNSPSTFIFETADGFRIKSDKVNRYLKDFNISSKDIRGYNANKWIIDILKKEEPKREISGDDSKDKKKRKGIFNKAVKETAKRVGHGPATLKKHYMIPELMTEYLAHGHVIDMKNMGYYSEGGRAMGDISVSDHFPNKNEMPDEVKTAITSLEKESADMDRGIYELFAALPVEVIAWQNIVPGQDFLRSSKSDRLKAVEDIYAIGLPWVVEYDGKFYVLDGHHRILEMHEKGIDIKAHVYHVDKIMHDGGKFKTNNMKKITVVYEFKHSKMGFQNSITVDANDNESAIEKAKEAVSEVYGSDMLKKFSFNVPAKMNNGGMIGTKKIQLKEILIHWVEGDTSKTDKFPQTYTSWKDANNALKPLIAAEGEGYNKAKFTVTFSDGEKYDGRLDLSQKEDNPTTTDNVVGNHIHDYLRNTLSNSRTSDESKKEIREWLNKYDLGISKPFHLPKFMLNKNGGIAMRDGGIAEEPNNEEAPTCICFSAYVKQEKPELAEKLVTQEVNESPELRSELDEAFQAFNGGKIKEKAPITNERLLEILNEEINKNGAGVWTERRKTAEEMLRMRRVKF